MEFIIPGKPQGKARARTFYNPKLGRTQSITPEKTVLYENLIISCFKAQNSKDGKSIGWFKKEPLEVEIEANYPIPKSTTKKIYAEILEGKIKPTKKPDADNIAKVVCDALNGIAYTDDTQITHLTISKHYTETEPFVKVSISEAEHDTD